MPPVRLICGVIILHNSDLHLARHRKLHIAYFLFGSFREVVGSVSTSRRYTILDMFDHGIGHLIDGPKIDSPSNA